MLIVDASVAVKFVATEIDSDLAEALISSPEPLVAPDWLLLEVGHALKRKQVEEAFGEAEAIDGLAAMADFFDELRPSRDLIAGAYQLSTRLNHAIYDCIYLELAMRQAAPLVTADRKFVNSARRGGLGEHVRLLAEYGR